MDNLSIRTVCLDEVNPADRTYALRHAREDCDEALADSLRRVGMLCPPLLQDAGDGQYAIVCGSARIACWRSLGHDRVLARVAPRDASRGDLLWVAIEDNLATRGLNLIEQAMAAEQVERYASQAEVLENLLPRLGRKGSIALVRRMKDWLALPLAVQNALARGAISEGLLVFLEPFPPADQDLLVRAVEVLRLTAGASRGFARDAGEVCRRDGITLDGLLKAMNFDPDGDRIASDPCKVRNRVLEALHAKRYPILSQLEMERSKALAEIRLGNMVRLRLPRDFEGEGATVEVAIRSREDLDRAIARLRESLRSAPDAWDALLNPRWEA